MAELSREEVLRNFGKALREARHQLGISQEELADRVSLDRTYVGGAERGERNVSLYNLVRLARALRVPLTDLLTEVDR